MFPLLVSGDGTVTAVAAPFRLCASSSSVLWLSCVLSEAVTDTSSAHLLSCLATASRNFCLLAKISKLSFCESVRAPAGAVCGRGLDLLLDCDWLKFKDGGSGALPLRFDLISVESVFLVPRLGCAWRVMASVWSVLTAETSRGKRLAFELLVVAVVTLGGGGGGAGACRLTTFDDDLIDDLCFFDAGPCCCLISIHCLTAFWWSMSVSCTPMMRNTSFMSDQSAGCSSAC